MKRRLLPVVVLLSCAILAVLAVLYSGFLSVPGAGRSGDPGPFTSDLEAQSRELDRQLQSTDAHRALLDRLSADLIARRRSLPQVPAGRAELVHQSSLG
jgi:hypothetical protein